MLFNFGVLNLLALVSEPQATKLLKAAGSSGSYL